MYIYIYIYIYIYMYRTAKQFEQKYIFGLNAICVCGFSWVY